MEDPSCSGRLKLVERADSEIVLLNESIPLSQKSLRSGSHWGINELRLLNVYFAPDEKRECLEFLEDLEWWSAEQREGISHNKE